MAAQLKSCPFCGGRAEIVKDRRWPGNSNGIDAWHVACTNYACVIFAADNTYFRRKHEAVAVWNRRVSEK